MLERCHKELFSNHITFNQPLSPTKPKSRQITPKFTSTCSFPHNKNILSLDPLSVKWKTAKKNESDKSFDRTERKEMINRVLIGESFELKDNKSKRRVYLKPPKPELSLNEKQKTKEKAINQLFHGKFSLKKKNSTEICILNEELEEKGNLMIEIKSPFFTNKKISNSDTLENSSIFTIPQTMSNSLTLSIDISEKINNKKHSHHFEKVQEIKRSTPVYFWADKKRQKMLNTSRGFSLLRTKTEEIRIDDVSGWNDLDDEEDDLTSTQATAM